MKYSVVKIRSVFALPAKVLCKVQEDVLDSAAAKCPSAMNYSGLTSILTLLGLLPKVKEDAPSALAL